MSDIIKTLSSPTNQPSVPQSGVKTGQQTIKLTSEDMYDRIINLRFIHKPIEPGGLPKSFTIRSDYEPLYFNGGFQYIICRQKPSIKISYKQVANETVIGLNIDIDNLFIKDMPTNETSYGVIQSVEVQIGYRSQMPDWANDPYWSKQPIQDFLALKDNNSSTDKTALIPPERITAQVLSVQRIGAPPNLKIRFQCVVGSVEQGLRWLFNESTLANDIKNQKSGTWGDKKPQNNLPSTFFQLVTKRFIRSSQRHDITDVEHIRPNTDGDDRKEVEQVLTTYDDAYTKATKVELVDGVMTPEDADKYGVIVYLSRMLWTTPMEELAQWGFTGKEMKDVEAIAQPPYIELYDKASAQLAGIVKQYPFIRYYLLSDGNYYAYHVKEGEQEIFRDPFVYAQQEKKIYKLPAVYDITWSGTRVIRCPFFSAISSLHTVAFQSKYTLNDITGTFYQPSADNNCYLVLLIDVSFATVDDDNEMILTCTDIEGKYKPITNKDGSIKPVKPEDIDNAKARTKIWKKVDLEATHVYRGQVNTIDASWTAVINLLHASAIQFKDAWETLPTVGATLDKLEEWNPDLFTNERLSYGRSSEDALFGSSVPILFGKEFNPFRSGYGDIIHIRYPYLPAYADDKEIK